MNKLFKGITAAVLALVMLTFGAPAWATTVTSVSVPITVTIAATGSNALTVDSSALTGFSVDYSTLDPSEAWVVADGYIKISVETESPEPTWGVRVVTNNTDSTDGLPKDYTTSATGTGVVNGVPGYQLDAAGTEFSYGGLYLITDSNGDGTVDTVTDNAANKATLAWQVYDAVQSTTPSAPTDASFDTDSDGTYGDWDAAWAYVGDELDTGYDGTDYAWDTSTSPPSLNYNVACYGSYLGDGLSSHPDTSFPSMTDTDSDGQVDAFLYLAAKFANTYWYSSGGSWVSTESFLPSGSYDGRMYIEMFTE